MSDVIWPLHSRVRHKKDGYAGWVHATTTLKDLFTGDVTVKWQYTIRVEGRTQLMVAPAEDLEWITAKAPFPDYVMYKESHSEKNYLQETRLHALGYQISDLNSDERWDILKFVAIPMLGPLEVVRTIMAVISSRNAHPGNADKFRHAFKAWNKDLNEIALHCKGHQDETSLRASIAHVQRKLLESKMIEEKDLLSQ